MTRRFRNKDAIPPIAAFAFEQPITPRYAADNKGMSLGSTNPRQLRLSQQRKLPNQGSFLCSFIPGEVFEEDGRLFLGIGHFSRILI